MIAVTIISSRNHRQEAPSFCLCTYKWQSLCYEKGTCTQDSDGASDCGCDDHSSVGTRRSRRRDAGFVVIGDDLAVSAASAGETEVGCVLHAAGAIRDHRKTLHTSVVRYNEGVIALMAGSTIEAIVHTSNAVSNG